MALLYFEKLMYIMYIGEASKQMNSSLIYRYIYKSLKNRGNTESVKGLRMMCKVIIFRTVNMNMKIIMKHKTVNHFINEVQSSSTVILYVLPETNIWKSWFDRRLSGHKPLMKEVFFYAYVFVLYDVLQITLIVLLILVIYLLFCFIQKSLILS